MTKSNFYYTEIAIVGAGAAGIGIGVILQSLNLPLTILEKDCVGSSFKKWPSEMRFISPSFTGNFFGQVDLNAITPDTSPAYMLQKEHPSGTDYARYLEGVAKHFELPVQTGYEIKNVARQNNLFRLETNREAIFASYVIWAAGEFQYPNKEPFKGAEYCIHNSQVRSWEDLSGDDFVVIGAYESGMDAAIQLAKRHKNVMLLDSENQLDNEESDSSYSLSPYTRNQYEQYKDNIYLKNQAQVLSVTKNGNYEVQTRNETLQIPTQPILATGFDTSLVLVNELFSFKDGVIQLTEHDESTKTSGLFLAGPQVQHDNAIFCFIYKYRQRFPIIAAALAERIGIEEKKIEDMIAYHQEMNFYLKDLSCCEDECAC